MSLSVHGHRDGMSTVCPFCDYRQDGLDWLRHRVETHPSSKKDAVAVVSRCPRCGERSWAHFDKPAYLALDAALERVEVEA